jgi:MscS family membrane protein
MVGLLGSALVFKKFLAEAVVHLLKKLASRTKGTFDDYVIEAVDIPLRYFIVMGALHIVALVFPWRMFLFSDITDTGEIIGDPEAIATAISICNSIFHVIYIILGGYFLFQLVDKISQYSIEVIGPTKGKLDITLIVTFRKFLKVGVLVLALMVILAKMGVDIKVLLASFTVATAAIAFAARDAIANVFGAFVLSLDRPFSIGDWVVIGFTEGNIEEIGLRSTRIRTFAKSLVHIPNNVLMNMTIENMSARPRQRVRTSFGVTYGSSPDKIEALVQGIRDIIRDNPRTFKDYYQVWFTEFGDSSLQVMMYFFIESTEWPVFLEERQKINIQIMRLVESLGLEFAFPSQSVYFHDVTDKTGKPA